MADYSLLGSFSTGGASALNGELLTKLKDAEKQSALFSLDPRLEEITGLDAETGEALDTMGESDTLTLIKAQALDLMSKVSVFDLDASGDTVFDAVSASTTGTAAVFDAVDVGGLEPGTTNITVSQLSQRDVYQTISFNTTTKDAQLSADQTQIDLGMTDEEYRDYVADAGISIKIGDETFNFSIVQDPAASTIAELGAKTIDELAAEINANENFIASVEAVGTDEYRLVIKSAESGTDNELTITQTNWDVGFGNTQSSTNTITTAATDLVGAGELNINGNIITTTATTTYQDLADMINGDNGYTGLTGITATVADGTTFDITTDDGSSLNIEQTGIDLGYSSNQVQKAQNLNANIDGIDYDVASNTITIQGNLTMTAVEIGTSTIDIQKDTSSILTGVQSIIESYNSLVELINEVTQTADSVINDSSSIRSLLSSVKEQLFGNYGENGDLNLFNYGMELDIQGNLSLNTTEFGEALVENYDDVKNLFLGNTTDEDLASTDSTKYLGLGTGLQDFLDNLDSSNGLITRYETNMASRLEKLQEERESTLKTLDSKYESLASQYSLYGSLITQMESSFSGLSMMIEQSVASK
jgi:flagellar hook-associated protein 2